MKFKVILFLSLLVLAVSCSKDKERTAVELPPVPVVTEELSESDSGKYITASGQIEAENSAQLSTRIMGYVTAVNVKVGEKVDKGQQLASISSSDLQAKKGQAEAGILQATAAFNNAKKDYERFQKLFDQNSATQKELDDMKTQMEMAKAQLETAKQMSKEVDAQFSYANLRAPFSGVVTGTFVKEGDMANPGMPIISLEDTGKLEAKVRVSESEISKIKPEMKAEVNIKSLNKTLQGKVTEISSSSRNTGGQYIVKVDLEDEDLQIYSGMFVNVRFEIDADKTDITDTESVMLIPKKAIIKEGQLNGVYVVGDDEVAILRWLRLGKTYGDQVEVLSGLSIGDQYVVEAEDRLYNGSKVSIK
ncbi:MAG TPA: efflux RND transporter periplasmic adaptor subunit [Flavobacteriaceae bacterium]|nr:efflux RND transporter periplasmic adaptor subunit [Flavobacteriaceae bacterium]